MTALDVWMNGKRLFTASLEDGMITAKLLVRNQVDPIWFNVDGRDRQTGGHVHWSHISAKAGDEFTIRIVEIEAGTTIEV